MGRITMLSAENLSNLRKMPNGCRHYAGVERLAAHNDPIISPFFAFKVQRADPSLAFKVN